MSYEQDLDETGYHEEEADRRLANILRPGTVIQVDEAAARVQVQTDEITTDWLPWFVGRAGKSREWSAPEIGEQVMILAPSGELAQGWVLRGAYKDDLPRPPGATKAQHITLFEDGTKTIYDLATKTMTVFCVGDIEAQAVGNITALAGENITATATGQINLTAGTQLNLAAQNINIIATEAIAIGAPTIGVTGGTAFDGDGDWIGNINHHDGSITSNGIVVHTHHHSGVQSGASNTGPPN